MSPSAHRQRRTPLITARTALRGVTVLACGALAAAALQVTGTPLATAVAPSNDEQSDRAAAMAEAVAEGDRVEVESARTASSAVYANPDGSWTFEGFSGGPATSDTWVQSLLPNTSQHRSPDLRVGTNNIGIGKARSYLNFDTSGLDVSPGTIVEASVELVNFAAGSCSGSPIRLSRVTSAWAVPDITWPKQPTTTAEGSSTNDTGHGARACADEGTVEFDATEIVEAWVGGAPNHGVQLRADKEGANAGWRKYRSLENTTGAAVPKLTVLLSQPPETPTDLTVTPMTGDYVTSQTPTLSAVVSDPDGGEVVGYFEISEGGYPVWTGTSEPVPSGQVATIEVPADVLEENTTYTVAAYGKDPMAVQSLVPAYKDITVDSVAPTVTISSDQFTDNTWTDIVPASATTILDSTWGTTGYHITYDGVAATIGAYSNGDLELTFQPTPGWHVLEVVPFDEAGNNGTPVTFQFGTGAAAFTTPKMWDTTTGTFPIDLSSRPGATGATVQWRIANEANWRTATELTNSDGSAWTGEVTGGSARSTTGPLTWSSTEEPFGTGLLEAPALLEIRGCFQYDGADDECSASIYVGLVEESAPETGEGS